MALQKDSSLYKFVNPDNVYWNESSSFIESYIQPPFILIATFMDRYNSVLKQILGQVLPSSILQNPEISQANTVHV